MLGVVAVAYLIATGLVYGLVEAGATTVSGQSTAILIVLMFGAGTDYCLLIVSRFRDELRRDGDVEAAMARAAARTGPGDPRLGRDRGRRDARARARRLQRHARDGPDPRARHRRDGGRRADAAAGAAGGVRAARVLAGGPARRGRAARRRARLAAHRRARPAPPGAAGRRLGRAILAPARSATSAAAATSTSPSSTATRRSPCQGQELIARALHPPGASRRSTSCADADVALAGQGRARRTHAGRGDVQHRLAVRRRPARSRSEVLLKSTRSRRRRWTRSRALRAARARPAGRRAVLVGGITAESHDNRAGAAARRAADRAARAGADPAGPDRAAALRRRAAVRDRDRVLSFAFALGASSLIFTHVFGQPDSDPNLTIFAFIFLVALGVDDNIFLMTRIREEHARGLPTRDAVIAGLRADRRRDHVGRADPRRHVRGADGARPRGAVPGRLHRRARAARRRVPGADVPRAVDRDAARRAQLVARTVRLLPRNKSKRRCTNSGDVTGRLPAA